LQSKELLLGVDEEHGQCGNEAIIAIICQYSELGTLFDSFFSMARMPTGELTESILEERKQCLHAMMLKWRDIWLSMKMAKIHGLEDHLIAMMEQ
jgi:nitrogen fixation/metabolism regulation signal transduction histidine kinase